MTERRGMRITYDEVADALGITLGDGPGKRIQQLGPGIRLDWGAKDEPLFLEILAASTLYPVEDLRALASPAIVLTLGEAAKESGLDAATLRVLIHHGRLPATKRGRDWIVTLADLQTYLASRKPAGRPAKRKKARRPKATTVRRASPTRRPG